MDNLLEAEVADATIGERVSSGACKDAANWLEEEGEQDGKASPFRIGGRSERAAHMTDDLRKEALRRCFENGENVGKVAKEIGCSRASIYNWKKKFGE